MDNRILKEIDFRDLRFLDHHVQPPAWFEALKTILFVNATLAVAFGIFYELIQLCLALDISTWWAAGSYVALFSIWCVRQCRNAPICTPSSCPDCVRER
jgi:hypothetical protein